MPSSLVCVNTLVANRLMRKATIERAIGSLSEYRFVRTEVKCFESSRLDILLENPAGQLCFLEIKSCTQVEDEIAYFPDAVTIRGRKHLCDLQRQVNLGNRAMILFLIQRTDSRLFRPADHIDPAYGDELRLAVQNRVQIQVYDVDLTLQYIRPNNQIPWEL
jgi:sugar fermentation stimulation protein A